MSERPVCNYEGSRYNTEFWTAERSYEDAAERIALKALLPPRGRRLVEIGAGFGRLADLYEGYEEIILFDYARTQLEKAVERLGHDDRYLFVQGNFYHLPFSAATFDTVTMIRTLHHAADAGAVIRNVAEILASEGVFVLEFASKHNLKALGRYLLRRQAWSPFDEAPVEFVELNFDFHPRWIWRQVEAAGLRREAVRTVSHFRIPWLKRLLPARLLARLDALAQPTGRWWQWSPSVFVRLRAPAKASPPRPLFRCPDCGTPLGDPPRERFACPTCGKVWARQEGIYNFRDPLNR